VRGGGRLGPRQRRDPVEVRPDHAVLGRGRGEPLEPAELAVDGAAHLLRERELVELGAELVQLRLLRVGLAELLLDRLQLLAEIELALPLLELRLHLRLDLGPELEHFELPVQDQERLAQTRLHVGELEQLLLLLGLQPHRRGDEVAERARVLDGGGRELQLLREVGQQADHAREQRLDVARERLHLLRLLDPVGDDLRLADEVRRVLDPAEHADSLEALDEDPQRPVGDLDHLVDQGRRPDVVELREAGLLDLRVADGDEREHPIAGHDVLDEPDRSLLADRERRHRLREDDRLLQREDRQQPRDLDVVVGPSLELDRDLGHGAVTSIGTVTARGGCTATGSTIVRSPCS
jgi:hypothetical protein